MTTATIQAAADASPGWTTNPSAWSQRLPIVALALIGTGVATYLALYQLDVVGTVWDPFFGDGSRRILNSKVSHLLPVPDAALGAGGGPSPGGHDGRLPRQG